MSNGKIVTKYLISMSKNVNLKLYKSNIKLCKYKKYKFNRKRVNYEKENNCWKLENEYATRRNN